MALDQRIHLQKNFPILLTRELEYATTTHLERSGARGVGIRRSLQYPPLDRTKCLIFILISACKTQLA